MDTSQAVLCHFEGHFSIRIKKPIGEMHGPKIDDGAVFPANIYVLGCHSYIDGCVCCEECTCAYVAPISSSHCSAASVLLT